MVLTGTRCRRGLLAPLAALLLVVACRGGDDASLPLELQIRSDVPYIEGRIVERAPGSAGGLRLVVESTEPGARTPVAVVHVAGGSTLYWSDGRGASLSDLSTLRSVTVWTDGPELRSLPPQIPASVIVLRRGIP